MPIWNEIAQEITRRSALEGPAVLDAVRRERLAALAHYTGRPAVIYAVDFLHQSQKTRAVGRELQINWSDKEGFVEVLQDLDPGPLDLIIDSPGGDPLAAESIVKLIRNKFTHVRVVIPNVAKSAATMLALSADCILMDERGELGPIDPQMIITTDQQTTISPAQAILDQFARASEEIKRDQSKLPVWLPLLRLYGPSLLVECQNAIELSKRLVHGWLVDYMFKGDADAETRAGEITAFFGEHNNFKAHGRMIGIGDLPSAVSVLDLRTDQKLRDLVWALYVAIGQTFDHSGAYKLIENQLGQAFIRSVVLPAQLAPPVNPRSDSSQPRPGEPVPEGHQTAQPNRHERRATQKAGRKAK